MVLLAAVAIAVIGKLMAYDYLREGWANIFQAQEETISVGTPDADAEQAVGDAQETEQTATANGAQETTPAVETEEKSSEVQKLLEDLKLDFEKVTTEQLFEAGFKNAKSISINFGGRIFNLVDVSDIVNADIGEFNISDEKNIYAVVVESRLQTELEAQDFYNLFKKRAQGLPGITTNENDQFGSASFFMNDPKKLGNAFLVVRIKNRVYFYTYPKANHEFTKKLIILLNR